jgi:hypothetical protein
VKKLGPTGDFPQGKINADDKGAIRIAITADPHTQKVYIDLGPMAITWLALDPAGAEELAAHLVAKARDAKRGGVV